MSAHTFWAHITESGDRQTVKDHLEATANLCSAFAGAFGAADLGYLVGLAHDIGKYSVEFQRRLLANGPRVDHSTAGAKKALDASSYPGAAAAVAGHHGGLPDLTGAEETTLSSRLAKERNGQLPDYSPWSCEIRLPAAEPPSFFGKDSFADAFFTRMLYSCLVDADYMDTENFMNGPQPRGNSEPLNSLRDKLFSQIRPWLENRDETTLNGRRSAILRACVQAGEDSTPLRTLTVPTGGGKTIASLAYALCHGGKFGKRRVIYVIPYTSIIEQTADEFRKWLGDDVVLEHHSGVDYTVEEGQSADPNQLRKALATENWDAPVIVTTSVQFFESLYASRSSRCRKLHNIVNSVVIFDEAQMLPLSYLRPCVAAIAQLVQRYGVSAVLCTATQPDLGHLFSEFVPSLSLSEIAPMTKSLYAAFRRTTLVRLGVMNAAALAERLNGHPQALCVVGTRRQAQDVYSLLDADSAFHLSTLMPPIQRRAVLTKIRTRLKDGLPCRVVSTSLIECGVDVDFPVVYRAEAGLDSILQSAGRCNREGCRPAGESFVYIFQPEDGVPSIFQPQRDAYRAVADAFPDVAIPEAIAAYFRCLRNNAGPSAQDKLGILSAFAQGMDGHLMPFRTVAERFHLIDSSTKTIYLPVDSCGLALSERLRAGERSRSLFRQLAAYSVNVYPQHFHSLYESGALDLLDEDAAILTDLSRYHPNTGLSLQGDCGMALFI